MDIYPVSCYLDIAVTTKAFRDNDLEILKEVIEDHQKEPKSTYRVINEVINNKLVGFIVFGRVPLTKYSWDIYWLAVRSDLQGKGIGKRLIEGAEAFIKAKTPKAVVRIETSIKKEYSAAHGLYERMKFKEMGRVPNFYSCGDDLIIYYKTY